MAEKLKIRTRSESLNKHYDECLELHCCLCQQYLLGVIQETKAALNKAQQQELSRYSAYIDQQQRIKEEMDGT